MPAAGLAFLLQHGSIMDNAFEHSITSNWQQCLTAQYRKMPTECTEARQGLKHQLLGSKKPFKR